MSWIGMRSNKYDIEFYPMTQHLDKTETADDYIERLIKKYSEELLIDLRFDKEEVIKLLDLIKNNIA